MNNYTDEQIKDISERIEKANLALVELELQPVMQFQQVEAKAGGVFTALIMSLQDTKYAPKPEASVAPVEGVVAEALEINDEINKENKQADTE